MSWDNADKKAVDSGGKFIKLGADEDSCKGVLMGQPTCEDVFFDKKTNKTRPFTEEDSKAGEKATPKFKFNMFTTAVNDDELEKPDMKIITVNATTYRFIAKLRQKNGGDLGWKQVYIVRNGKAGDTSTTYNVSISDNDLSEELQKKAKAAKTHNLEENSSGEEASGGGDFGSYDSSKKEKEKEEEDGPLSKEQSSQLSQPYRKELSGDLQEFMTKFGVQKFKDIKKSQFEEAMAYTRAKLKPADAPAEDAEEDPFG